MKISLITDSIDEGLLSNHPAGIFKYTKQLAAALLRIDRQNEYTLVHFAHSGADLYARTRELIVPVRRIPFGREIRKALLLPMSIRKESFDIIHEPRAFTPYLFPSNLKTILTVHDLSSVVYPTTHTVSNVIRNILSLRACVKRVDKIITVSEFSKRELVRVFKISRDRIEVVHEGVDPSFKRILDSGWVRKKYGIDDRFILYLGTLQPRKNIARLILAFRKLKKKGMPYKLVLAGRRGLKSQELELSIKRLSLDKDVILPGYVKDDEVPALYSASELFVYPSFYEGFGLPVLEAMACGTPVVTSNTSSLQEIARHCSVMVNPYDVDSITDAMYEVLTDSNLAKRLVKKGLKRAAEFSWDETAKKTIDVYKKTLE